MADEGKDAPADLESTKVAEVVAAAQDVEMA